MCRRELKVVKGPNAIALLYRDRAAILNAVGPFHRLREFDGAERIVDFLSRPGRRARRMAVEVATRWWTGPDPNLTWRPDLN